MSASFARTLIQQLHLETSRSITLIGAGGKTTLLYALSTALSQKENTLLTTTTHIMEPRDLPGAVLITKEDRDALATAFRTSRLVALGIPVSKNRFCSNAHVSADLSSASPKTATPKWASPSLSFLRKIRDIPSRIVCEGDGSRRLPVKIPREGEPVFFPRHRYGHRRHRSFLSGAVRPRLSFRMGSGRHPAGISRTARCPGRKPRAHHPVHPDTHRSLPGGP